MPGLNVGVSLIEALEVRGSALQEQEVWAVLCQACEALQDVFLKENHNSGGSSTFVITPDTLMLSAAGRVHFNRDNSFTMYDRSCPYVPPEVLDSPSSIGDDGDALEKINVFSLGMTMYNAADYNLPKNQELGFSDGLDSLLCAMCEETPHLRLSLVKVLEACSDHSQKQTSAPPYSHYISSLYKLVLGSTEDMTSLFVDATPSKSPTRTSTKNRSPASSKSSPGSKSHSSSKSKDRHGGSGSSHQNGYSERPRPIGRDWMDGASINGHDSVRHSGKRKHNRSHYNKSGASSSTNESFQQNRNNNTTYQSSRLRDDTLQESTMMGPSYHLSDISFGSSEPNGVENSRLTSYMSKASQRLSKYSHEPSMNKSRHSTNLHRSVLQKSSMNNGLERSRDPNGHSQSRRSTLVENTYARLKERRRKLEVLRRGLSVEDYRSVDAISLSDHSLDNVDVKSLASAPSYTHGSYRPHLYPQYGSTVALHMATGGSTPEQDESVVSSEAPYVPREVRRSTQRKSTTRSKKPAGSRREAPDDVLDPALMLSTVSDWEPHYLNHMVSSTDPYAPVHSVKRSTKRMKTVENPTHFYDNTDSKRHFGPEFVAKAQEPEVELRVPVIKHRKKAQARKVNVVLLSGERLLVACNTRTQGSELLETVVSHLSLPEHYFFGITHVKDGEHFFIDADTKLHKVAPVDWKEPPKGQLPSAFTLFFRVRFYVNRLAALKHGSTKHLFYLQLRRDILEERTLCSEEEMLSLSALALQAEYGDHNREIHGRNYFQPEHYISPRLLRRLGTSYFRDNLPPLHVQQAGCGETESEMKYLQESQKLEEYGIHFHKVLKNKNDYYSHIWAGLSVHGLYLAEKSGSERKIVHRHPWVQTEKISFNRRRFSILPKSDSEVLKLSKFSYYTESYKNDGGARFNRGRYLLQQCTTQHRFQIQMRSRENVSQMFRNDYPSEGAMTDKVEYVPIPERDDIDLSPESPADSEQDEDMEEEESPYTEVQLAGSRRVTKSHAGSSNRPPLFANDHPLIEAQRNTPNMATHSQHRQPRTSMTPGGKSTKAYVVDASIYSQDRSLFPHLSETISDSLNERFENIPVPDSPERHITMVAVAKDSSGGLGITVVGGEDPRALDLGIFIKTVIPGGPADQTGSVFPGDRIVAINGQSLEGMPQQVAVDLIKNSPRQVQLLLSQVKVKGDSISGYEGDFEDPAGLRQVNQNSFSSGSNMSVAEHAPLSTQSEKTETRKPMSQPRPVVERIATAHSNTVHTSNASLTNGRKTPNNLTLTSTLEEAHVDVDAMSSSDDEQSDMEVANILPQTPSADFNPYETIQFSDKKPPSGNKGKERGGSVTPKAEPVYATINKSRKQTSADAAEPPVVENQKQKKSEEAPDESVEVDSEVTIAFQAAQAAQLNRGKHTSAKTPSPAPPVGKKSATPQQRPGSNFSAFSDSPLSLGGYDASSSSTPHPPSVGDLPDDLSPGDRYEVLLDKINNSLGLNVTGGVNTSVKHGGIYVKTLVQEGAADQCGRIRIGDRVLFVNDVSLEGVTHKQAVETLRSAPQVCRLVMERGVPLPPRTGMSPAFKTPPVTPGLSEYDSVSMGRKSEKDGTDGGEEDSSYHFVNKDNTFEVDLQKASSGLGFSVYGGVTATNPDPNKAVVRVRKIFPLGAAASSGKLEVGDVILEVNGKSIRGMTHNETVTLLRTAPPVTRLLLCRPRPGILPPLPERGRDSPYDRDAMSPVSFGLSPTPLSTVSEKSRSTPTSTANLRVQGTPTSNKLVSTPKPTNTATEQVAEVVNQPQVKQSAAEVQSSTKQFGGMGLEDSESESEYSESDSEESAPSVVRSPVQSELLREDNKNHETPVNQGVTQHNVTPTPVKELDRMLVGMETPRKTPFGRDSFTSQSSMRDTPHDHLTREDSLQSSTVTPMNKLSRTGSGQSSVITPPIENSQSVTSQVDKEESQRSNTTDLERTESFDSDISKSSVEDSRNMPAPSVGHSESPSERTVTASSDRLPVNGEEGPSHNDTLDSSAASPLPQDDDVSRRTYLQPESDDDHSFVSDSSIEGEIEVTLTKQPGGGLGFTVGGGNDEIGPYIKAVVADPAKSDGRLQPGDQLMMVNDQEMVEMTHSDAVKFLRSTPQTVTIIVYRDPEIPPPIPTSAPPSAREEKDAPPADLKTTMELAEKYSTDGHQSSSPDLDTPRASDDEEEAHFTILEPSVVSAQDSHSAEQALRRPSEGSVSQEEEPKRSVQDLIKNFNAAGASIIKPHQYGASKLLEPSHTPEVVEPVYSSPESRDRTGSAISYQSKSDVSWGDVSLPLSDDAEDREVSEKMDKPVAMATQPESGAIRIDLTKPINGGLGFSLVTSERGSANGIYIKAVTPGSVAAQDGRLRVGDKLLQVNGESVIGMTQSRAVAVLRKTRGVVTLAVSRLSQSRPNSNVGAPAKNPLDREDLMNKLQTNSPAIAERSEPISDDDSETLQSLIDSVNPSYQESLGDATTMSHDGGDSETDYDSSEFDWPNENESNEGAISNNKRKSHTSVSSQRSYASSLRSTGSRHSNSSHKSVHSNHSNTSRSNGGGKIRVNPKYADPPPLPKSAPPEDTDSESDVDSWGDDSDVPLPGDERSFKAMRPAAMSDSDAASMLSEPYSTSLLPHEITSDWLSRLVIAETVPGGQYSGHAVQSIISQLQAKIDREEPLEEYKHVRQVRLTDNCDDAKLPENKPKNRYRNVLPYDGNRVCLSGSDNYINASHIRVPLGKDVYEFIACQGPLQQTTDDFWRMVWEKEVNTIAMVTLDMESGKVKCHRYWPDSVESPVTACDRFKVSLLKSQRLANFDVRDIQIEDKESGDKHNVIHLNYTTWPDHGVPKSARPLLQYIRLMHLVHNGGPIVVHCSAGIGRTGALITIDTVLGSIERDLKFDINSIVTELRKQRSGMIQTKDQYLFCYKACIEALQTISNGQ